MSERFPAYCTLCRSRCGCTVVIDDGKLSAVEPLADHPTGGALCAKGRAAPELVASPNRLTRPLKRTNPRGAADPGWQEITWDEALDEITRRIGEIRAEHGAEAVAFAVTTPSGTPMVDSFEWVERFIRCFGSPNLIYAIEVCGWHKDYAQRLTFGRGIGRWIIGERRVEWTIQIVPWGGMVLGAIVGAVLTRLVGSHALWLVSLLTMAVACAAIFIPRPLQRRFNQKIAAHQPVLRLK